MQSSDLWLNGKHVGSRRGGYLPMVVDLTGQLRADNILTVRVDSSDNALIPPGKPQKDLDFMYGNGITRNAFLTVTAPLHITDAIAENIPLGGGVYVTCARAGGVVANLKIRTHIRNGTGKPQAYKIQQDLYDAVGKYIATTESARSLKPFQAEPFTQDLIVPKAKLWSPDSPYLYVLKTSIMEGVNKVDEVDTCVGIRTIEVSRQRGFIVNGKPLRLIGTNRHQDYPWVGPALSNAANARDASLIRKAGHNIVRLSHYPQSPSFLDACDKLGLMTIPCIPGWQFMNKDPIFTARVRQDIRDLIRRDRNHPCAVFWEASLNETYPPVETAKEWDATAKSESLTGNILTAGDATTGAPWDIAYNQWKDEDFSRPQDAAPNKPGYIREYGDYEFGGPQSTSRVPIGQGMDKLLQETWNHVWSYNKYRPQYPWTMGAGTWEMFDHNVPWNFRVSASGLADLFRMPKPSFWFYTSQVAPQPMVKIAATWQPGAAARDVVVFTNCDQAKLSVNGRDIAVQSPQRGDATTYGAAKLFDGSNTANLAHPPIVFRNVPFTAGVLKAVGLVNGRGAASDTVTTAGKPARLKVWVDDLGIQPERNDLVFVRATLVDANGRECTGDLRNVSFVIHGDAAAAGEAHAETQMGTASILARTSTTAKRFTVKAVTSDGLLGSTSTTIR